MSNDFYMSEQASRELIQKLYKVPVMNKPTAAQLKDPQWWGVWAPEDATHYSEYYGAFVKPFDAEQWVVLRQGPKPVVTFMDTGILIRRPESSIEDAHPAALELTPDEILASCVSGIGTWRPPTGCVCEVDAAGISCPADWRKCYVVGVEESGDLVVKVYGSEGSDEYEYSETRTRFRPARSQAEREREEVIVLAKYAAEDVLGFEVDVEICAALYDAGMLRRAGK